MWKIEIHNNKSRNGKTADYYFNDKEKCEIALQGIINSVIRKNLNSSCIEVSNFYQNVDTLNFKEFVFVTFISKTIFIMKEIITDDNVDIFDDIDKNDKEIITLERYDDNYTFYLKDEISISLDYYFFITNRESFKNRSFNEEKIQKFLNDITLTKRSSYKFNTITFNPNVGICIKSLCVSTKYNLYIENIKLDKIIFKDLYSKIYKKYTELSL